MLTFLYMFCHLGLRVGKAFKCIFALGPEMS
jgi:hypothetical protein